MKLGEFKLAAYINNDHLHVAYKNKAGLLFTVKNQKKMINAGQGIVFYIGKEYSMVFLADDSHLRIDQPAKQESVKVKLLDRDKFIKFCSTDYNGYQID